MFKIEKDRWRYLLKKYVFYSKNVLLCVLMAVSENSKSLAFNYLTDFCRGKNKHIKSSFLFFKLMLHVLFIYISTLCKLKGFLNSHRHQHTARHFCYKRHISIFTIFSLQFCSWVPNLLLCLHLQNTKYHLLAD